jgi:hypothetical protein
MNQNPRPDRPTLKTLSTPPPLVKAESSKFAVLHRKLFDIASEGVCNLIKRWRPRIESASQCRQDLFVIEKIFRRKREGFFLEIGGGDGVYLSNTLILERDFEWRGILVEPTSAFEPMVRNRPKATCERSAISGRRKIVRVFEILDKGQARFNPAAADANTLMSVIGEADAKEPEFKEREWGAIQKSYLAETITLDDLLTKHAAPSTIDYFSFDVEGAEYDILSSFPFARWKFNCISIETPTAELNKLLLDNNYMLIKADILDSFYLHSDFLEEWLDVLC